MKILTPKHVYLTHVHVYAIEHCIENWEKYVKALMHQSMLGPRGGMVRKGGETNLIFQ